MTDVKSIPGLDEQDSTQIAAVWDAPDAKLMTLIKAGRLDPTTDFVRGDFRGWPLAGQDLRGIDFTGADLRGTGIESAIRDETTILTGAILDDISALEKRTPRKKMTDVVAGGTAWTSHWHAGVHASFGQKFYVILVRFSTGSIFVKDSVVRDLQDAGIADFMIFKLYSQWDILVRAWGDHESIELLKRKLDGNAEISHLNAPRFLEIEEIDHFPDRGLYPTVASVQATLVKTPTEYLRDAQDKVRKSDFYEGLKRSGLILDNDTRFVNNRIQFYIFVRSTQEPATQLLRDTLSRIVRDAKDIKSKSVYLAARGATLAVIKGQVQPGRYYDVYDFLKRLTDVLQGTLRHHIETETMLVASQDERHSSRIDFDHVVRDPRVAYIVPANSIVEKGEGDQTEFKSTLRTNLHTGQKDARMELEVLKTLAAFVNSSGGRLLIGVSDDGKALGLGADQFGNEDKMNRHLVSLIRDRMGPQHMGFMHMRFDDYQGKRVLIVECQRGRAPVFVKEGSIERFFLRTGAATTELSGSALQDYVKHHFR